MENRTLSEEDFKIWTKFKTQNKYQYERFLEDCAHDELLEKHKDEIDDFIGKKWHTEGAHGWECHSPVKVCVYSVDSWKEFGDECCSYCGQPEERK